MLRTVIISLVAGAVVSALPWGPPEALAQEGVEEDIRVIQQRPFLRKGRGELAPYFAFAMNETLFTHLGVGIVVNYHILENLSVGASYAKYFSHERELFQDVQDDYRVYPEKWELDWYAGGHVAYVPVYGKFILFNSAIVHWDAYLIAGLGATRTSITDAAFTGNLGLGSRLFLAEGLTLNFEVRDYIFEEDFKGGARVVNNVMLQVGLSIFLPWSVSYRYPK